MPNVPTEQRRAELVQAAVRVIAKHGVSGATTRRIAEEAGAGLATLHYCFTRKEDLFLDVFRQLSDEFASAAGSGVNATDVATTAGEYLANAVEWMIANETFAIAQLDLYVWMLRHNEQLAQQSYQAFFDDLIPMLAVAAPQATPRDIEILAGVVLGMFDGLTIQWFSHRDSTRTRAQVDLQVRALKMLLGSQLTGR